jgi:GAF domain-containing protein
VISGDVRGEPDYRLVPFMVDVRSELAVPIWADGQVWGAIDIEEVHPDAFEEDDARLIQTVADQIGSALRVATLASRLEQARDALAAAGNAGSSSGHAAESDSSEARQSRSTLAS